MKSLGKNLGLALAVTPIIAFIGLIIITLIGALDDAITKIQLSGHWWIILIAAYLSSLIGVSYYPIFRKNREREKVVNSLILYWEEQLAKQNKPQPSHKEKEKMHEIFLERIKVWAWFNPESWTEYFPNEKYSKSIFGIVDNFINKNS